LLPDTPVRLSFVLLLLLLCVQRAADGDGAQKGKKAKGSAAAAAAAAAGEATGAHNCTLQSLRLCSFGCLQAQHQIEQLQSLQQGLPEAEQARKHGVLACRIAWLHLKLHLHGCVHCTALSGRRC
jgi:hypothetical protein